MLIAALYFYLFGGSVGDGLVFDVSEPVKQYVLVKATAKQVIAVNKDMLKEEAAFAKESKKPKKQLEKLNANRLATEGDFAAVFAVLDAKRAAAREKILDGRFKMRELMSAEQWRQVYAVASRE